MKNIMRVTILLYVTNIMGTFLQKYSICIHDFSCDNPKVYIFFARVETIQKKKNKVLDKFSTFSFDFHPSTFYHNNKAINGYVTHHQLLLGIENKQKIIRNAF